MTGQKRKNMRNTKPRKLSGQEKKPENLNRAQIHRQRFFFRIPDCRIQKYCNYWTL